MVSPRDIPNGISIGSVVFAWLILVASGHTQIAQYNGNNRPHFMPGTAVQPKKTRSVLHTKFTTKLCTADLNGSRSSLLPMIDSPVVPTSLDIVRDSTDPADEGDLVIVGICRPVCGKPIPRRPASRHFTVAGNDRLVRASFCSCRCAHH